MCRAHALRPHAQNYHLGTCRGWLAPARPPARCPSAWPWPPGWGGLCKSPRTRQGEQLCPLRPACSPGCAGSVQGLVPSLGSGPAPCSNAGTCSRPRDVGVRGRSCCGQHARSGQGGGARWGWQHSACTGAAPELPTLPAGRPAPFFLRSWGCTGVAPRGQRAQGGPVRAGAGAGSVVGVRGPSPPASQGEGQGASALQSSWPRTRRK